MDKQLVYVASPYIHKEKEVILKRYEDVAFVTAEIITNFPELVPFSPIVYTHNLQEYCDISPDWYAFDLAFLAACKLLVVVQLDGWEQSRGIAIETNYAKANDIPIVEVTPLNVVEVLEQWLDTK